MGVFQRVKAAFSGKNERVGTGLELPTWRQAPPRRSTTALLQAYKELPRLATVIDVVGDAVANVEWTVYRRKGASGKVQRDFKLRRAPPDRRWSHRKALAQSGELEEVPDHPMLTLMDDPNDFMTGRDFIKLIVAYWDLVGEAFVVIEEVAGIPVGLWPVPPDHVLQLPDLSRPREERYYTILAGGNVFSLPAASVIALKRLDPADPLGRGVGAAHALGDELDTDEYAARFTKNSFYNNVLPGAVIAIEGMSDNNKPSVKLLKESLAQEFGGADKAGRVMVTNGKTSISRLDTPFKDMQLVELRKFLNDFCRMTYRVPPEVIGDIQNSNKAVSYAAREHLAEQCVVPRAEVVRTPLQKYLMPRFAAFGGEAYLDYESPVPADQEFSLRVMGTLPEAYSYDEWRGMAGFKPDLNRQGYPMPLPGQKPGGQQTPAPEDGGAAEANQEAVSEG